MLSSLFLNYAKLCFIMLDVIMVEAWLIASSSGAGCPARDCRRVEETWDADPSSVMGPPKLPLAAVVIPEALKGDWLGL
jgi:hypothetical protein